MQIPIRLGRHVVEMPFLQQRSLAHQHQSRIGTDDGLQQNIIGHQEGVFSPRVVDPLLDICFRRAGHCLESDRMFDGPSGQQDQPRLSFPFRSW